MQNLEKKACNECKEPKHLEAFYKNASQTDGHDTRCKQCITAYHRKSTTVIRRIYASQKKNSKARGHVPPNYTVEELLEWSAQQTQYAKVYSLWVTGGYLPEDKPSLDRLDDYKPYALTNLQVLTWRENNLKGAADRRNGINRKGLRPVSKYNKEGVLLTSYISCTEAAKANGIGVAAVNNSCNRGNRKRTRDYYVYTNMNQLHEDSVLDKVSYASLHGEELYSEFGDK